VFRLSPPAAWRRSYKEEEGKEKEKEEKKKKKKKKEEEKENASSLPLSGMGIDPSPLSFFCKWDASPRSPIYSSSQFPPPLPLSPLLPQVPADCFLQLLQAACHAAQAATALLKAQAPPPLLLQVRLSDRVNMLIRSFYDFLTWGLKFTRGNMR
jgi:hypothetical protein